MKKSYSYIWYPLTNYYDVLNENINFKISKNISPYIELNDENFNNLLRKNIIELNPFKRFNDEFSYIVDNEKYMDKKNILELFYNISFHLLGEFDLYVGQNKKDICVKEIIKGFEAGALGLFIKEKIKIFKEYERHIIASILYEMYRNLSSIDAFKEAIKQLYPDSIIYDKISSKKNIIVYLNYLEEKNKIKIELIKNLFLPLGLDVDIFWEKHFGIVGVPVTMKIGEMAIY